MARARAMWPILLSVSDLAAAMHVDRRVIYRMVEGGLPLYRIGVKKRMLITDVLAFIPQFFTREGVPK